MKKLFLLLVSISIIAIACHKDPELPIDKFVNTFDGNYKEYTCDSIQSIKNIFENYRVEFTKVNDTKLNGKLFDDAGNKLFSFEAELNADDDSKIKISNFNYNSETLFGGGQISNDKLDLQFATTSCPVGENTFRVTREFQEL
jgi:hypothetical protein